LLKIVEEPPAGYHFLFLTANKHALPTTITSRCSIYQLEHQSIAHEQYADLLQFFTSTSGLNDPLGFESTLRKQSLSHTQAHAFANYLLNYFQQKLRTLCTTDKEHQSKQLLQRIATIQHVLKKPPQSGSALLFLKMLYLLI